MFSIKVAMKVNLFFVTQVKLEVCLDNIILKLEIFFC